MPFNKCDCPFDFFLNFLIRYASEAKTIRMCQNSAYIKLWLYDEIISGQMPLWKVPKDIYFFLSFSLLFSISIVLLITHIAAKYASILSRELLTCLPVYQKASATEFLTNQKVSHQSKFQRCLWLLIGPKIRQFSI